MKKLAIAASLLLALTATRAEAQTSPSCTQLPNLACATTAGDTISGTWTFDDNVTSPFIFEGATDDANETTIQVTDPTADRTITIPNETGTICVGQTGAGCPTGTATAWDDIGDPDADATIGMAEYDQDMAWDTGDVTAAAFDGLTISLEYDPSTTDSGEQNLVVIRQVSDAGDATGTPDSLLLIETLEATADDGPAAGIEIRATTSGTMPIAIDATDAEIGVALALGNNTITHAGGTVTSSDLDIIDDGTIGTADIADNNVYLDDIDNTVDTIGGNPAYGANEVWFGTTGLIFEGATANTAEGLLTAADVTADRTWTLPDVTGTIVTTGDTDTVTSTMINQANNFTWTGIHTIDSSTIDLTGAASKCARFDASGYLVAATGDCTAGDTGGSNALLDGSVHTDTVAQAVTRGSIIYGNATPAWDELTIGGANTFLHSDGTDAAWAAISASDIGAGDLANALTWAEVCTESGGTCSLANAPRVSSGCSNDGSGGSILAFSNGLQMKCVSGTPGPGINEFSLSSNTFTFGNTANSPALVYYER